MKYIFLCVLLGWMPFVGLNAQTAKSCFLQVPDSLLPLLSEVNRADFIDFLESNMKAEVSNRLGGKSEMTHLTDSYINIRLTSQSTWQMKLLPGQKEGEQVICVVSTVSAPAADSRIGFYTTDWTPLPARKFLPALPAPADFIAPRAEDDTLSHYAYRDAVERADISFLQAHLSPDNTDLMFIFSTPRFLEKETAEILKPYLRRSVTYLWDGKKFTSPLSGRNPLHTHR